MTVRVRAGVVMLLAAWAGACGGDPVPGPDECCIGSECVSAGDVDPKDPCRRCDPRVSQHEYSPVWSNAPGCRDHPDSHLYVYEQPWRGAVARRGRREGERDVVQLVGFPGADPGETGLVEALPFAPSWDELAKPPGVGARVGTSVVLGGDFSGDGFPDFVVGAPGDGGGRVAVFTHGGQPLHDLRGRAVCSAFGSSVSIGPDVDGDGTVDLAIAAPGTAETPPECVEGRVFVVSGASGAIIGEIAPPSGSRHMGSAGVVLGPSYAAAGVPSVVAASSDGTGAVWVFDAAEGTLLASWSAPVPDGPDDVDYGGDGDGDGLPDIVVVGHSDPPGDRPMSDRSSVRLLGRAGAPAIDLGAGNLASYGGDADGDGLADVLIAVDGVAAPDHDVLLKRAVDGEPIYGDRSSNVDLAFISTIQLVPDLGDDRRDEILLGGPQEDGRFRVRTFESITLRDDP